MGSQTPVRMRIGLSVPPGVGPFPALIKEEPTGGFGAGTTTILERNMISVSYTRNDLDPDIEGVDTVGVAQAAYSDYDWATLARVGLGGHAHGRLSADADRNRSRAHRRSWSLARRQGRPLGRRPGRAHFAGSGQRFGRGRSRLVSQPTQRCRDAPLDYRTGALCLLVSPAPTLVCRPRAAPAL